MTGLEHQPLRDAAQAVVNAAPMWGRVVETSGVIAALREAIELPDGADDDLLQAARWVVENWDREATQHASMAALRQAVSRRRIRAIQELGAMARGEDPDAARREAR